MSGVQVCILFVVSYTITYDSIILLRAGHYFSDVLAAVSEIF